MPPKEHVSAYPRLAYHDAADRSEPTAGALVIATRTAQTELRRLQPRILTPAVHTSSMPRAAANTIEAFVVSYIVLKLFVCTDSVEPVIDRPN